MSAIKLPVRASKHNDIAIVDVDGAFVLKVDYVYFDNPENTKTIARRAEIMHDLNGYDEFKGKCYVAVKALTAISECRVQRPNSVAEQTLKELGELDE